MLGRLLTLVMLAITWTNAWADTYVVAGQPGSFFNGVEWGASAQVNQMTENTSIKTCALVIPNLNNSSNVSIQYKFVKNGSEWYGNNGSNISATISSSTKIAVFYFNTNDKTHSLTQLSSLRVAGVSSVFGSDWNTGDTNNNMSFESGTTFSLTKQNVTLAPNTNYSFKVVYNGGWTEAYQSNNKEFTVSENGIYDVKVTFDI